MKLETQTDSQKRLRGSYGTVQEEENLKKKSIRKITKDDILIKQGQDAVR